MKRPLTCVNLIKAIGALSVGQDPVRLSRNHKGQSLLT